MTELFGVPSDSVQCFVHSGEHRLGPYLPEQIRTMWQNGSITADATMSWDGCTASVPLITLMNDPIFATPPSGSQSSSDSRFGWRVGMTIVGGAIGLLVSYLLRPTILGQGPSFEDWFTEGLNSPFASTIYTCAIIGLLVGFMVGHTFDSNAKNK